MLGVYIFSFTTWHLISFAVTPNPKFHLSHAIAHHVEQPLVIHTIRESQVVQLQVPRPASRRHYK